MNLSRMLAGIVDHRLEGAACTGRWATFDPRGDHEPTDAYRERVERARAICGRCPVMEACRDTAGNLRPSHRSGIWAGIAYDRHGKETKK